MGNQVKILSQFFSKKKEKIITTDISEFHKLQAVDIMGNEFLFEQFKDKSLLLIVNIASLSKQHFKQLNQLYEEYSSQGFQVLAFPCNQFNNQETKCEQDIQKYIMKEFNASFMLFSKINVNGPFTHVVYRYLRTNSSLYDQLTDLSSEVPWNYSKFLVDKKGLVRGFYPPDVEPLSLGPAIKSIMNE